MFNILETWPSTKHRFSFSDTRDRGGIKNDSVDLIVTSPPYPMIEMWDESFDKLTYGKTKVNLSTGRFRTAWYDMIKELSNIIADSYDILKEGGFLCLNIGDALGRFPEFSLIPNISKLHIEMFDAGFTLLPYILWIKKANSPASFLGPGMIPGGYVTLNHEVILIGRKGGNRKYSEEEKSRRGKSAFFWEERNSWFSSIWNISGVKQGKDDRTGAYPLSIPFRLINMFSIIGDTVLDPFVGTGTTSLAAAISGRNSIGFEINKDREKNIRERMKQIEKSGKFVQEKRIEDHKASLDPEVEYKYYNKNIMCSVRSKQEESVWLRHPTDVKELNSDNNNLCYEVIY